MPRGASPKREREYNEIKEKFHEEGRYRGREEEVAARIVNKQRTATGETKAARAKGRTPTAATDKGNDKGSKPKARKQAPKS